MKNKEAARYARWSAGVAIAIVLAVLAVYMRGRMGARAVQKNLPAPVPASVAQESAGFTISRTVNHHTLFKVRASRATEFKDQNRSLLEDVTITIYGPQGDRNDSVQAGECSYEPSTGGIRCQGKVEVDLRNAKAKASTKSMHLETSNISFDHDTGRVTTSSEVTLKFPGGEGQGTGIVYEPESEDVKLERNVELKLTAPGRNRALPVDLTGRALEFRRSTGVLVLSGPVRAVQGKRTLAAGALEVDLDASMQPKSVVATGQPELSGTDARGTSSVVAEQIVAFLGAGDALEKIVASGNVRGQKGGPGGANRFSADHVELTMVPGDGGSEPHEMLATGHVRAETRTIQAKRDLETEALRLDFAHDASGSGMHMDTAETLAPGQVVTSQRGESDQIRGGKLTADFDARSQLTQLHGTSGVKVIHKSGSEPAQTTTAQNLTATFGAGDSGWQTIDENGSVNFRQDDRTAQADQARFTQATDQLALGGSAEIADATSRLAASRIEINQKTGQAHAQGSVVASYVTRQGDPGSGSGTGPANVSADEMTGTFAPRGSGVSKATGQAIFSGHARFWQETAVLQGRAIEFWRDEKRAEARGEVLATFAEPADKGAKDKEPTIWQVRAPKVDYWSDAGRAELSGGVKAHSDKGTITSRKMELLLSGDGGGQQKLERAIAEGAVRIEQNGRTGTAERGEYDAGDGKFILSGGQPTLEDGSGNTTTGRELTFFLASDTILVESEKGTRTVTMHRVVK
ncbi:MAG: LPS export ABC transporter periplasmic protein LptC [Candidatus Acidiferrales bacterium]